MRAKARRLLQSQGSLDLILVDYLQLMSGGGKPSQCGWLKDKYGLSWQVVPKVLPQLLKQTDAQKSQRVMQALLQMQKIDISALERAAR